MSRFSARTSSARFSSSRYRSAMTRKSYQREADRRQRWHIALERVVNELAPDLGRSDAQAYNAMAGELYDAHADINEAARRLVEAFSN